MPVSDLDQARIVELLVQDLRATVGTGHEHLVENNAERLREFIDDSRVTFNASSMTHNRTCTTSSSTRPGPDARCTRIRCGFVMARGGANGMRDALHLSANSNQSLSE
jgi:hypothetical protein